MQWLMKCCARGALGLTAAALLLAGVPVHAQAGSGAPDAVYREGQPLLLAQSTTQQDQEKLRQEELKKKAEQQQQQEKQQQAEPKKLKTRGAIPEAAPEATPPAKPGGKRFGAGVVRHGDPGDAEQTP